MHLAAGIFLVCNIIIDGADRSSEYLTFALMIGIFLNDLYQLETRNMRWTDISTIAKGNPPSPRGSSQFAVIGEKIYAFGGFDQNGKA